MKKTVKILLIIALIFSSIYCVEKKSLYLSTFKDDPITFSIVSKIVDSLSVRLNVKFNFQYLPATRGFVLLNAKKIDGAFAASETILDKNPDLIKVEEPIIEAPIYVYTILNDIIILSLEDLKPYKIVKIRGVNYTDKNLKGFNTYTVNSNETAFKFLSSGKADIFIGMHRQMAPFIDKKKFLNHKIYKLDKPIDSQKYYTFFTNQNIEFANKYNQALKDFKESGNYKKIFLPFMKDISANPK